MLFFQRFILLITETKTRISLFFENINKIKDENFIKSPIISYVILSLLVIRLGVIRVLPFFPNSYIFSLVVVFVFIALQFVIDIYIFPRSKVFRYIETVCSFYLFSKFRSVRRIIYKIMSLENGQKQKPLFFFFLRFSIYGLILFCFFLSPSYIVLENKKGIAIASLIYIILFVYLIYTRIRTSFINTVYVKSTNRQMTFYTFELLLCPAMNDFGIPYKYAYGEKETPPNWYNTEEYSRFPFPDHFSKNSSEHIMNIADYKKITPFILALVMIFYIFLIYLNSISTGVIDACIRLDEINETIKHAGEYSDMGSDHLKYLKSKQTEYKDKIRGYLPFIWEAVEPILNAQLKRNNIAYTIAKLRETF